MKIHCTNCTFTRCLSNFQLKIKLAKVKERETKHKVVNLISERASIISTDISMDLSMDIHIHGKPET